MWQIRECEIWPPIFYTLVWMIGFFIGIFGFLDDAEGPAKLVAGAFTAYGIFILNAVIDFWVFLVKNLTFKVKPFVAYILLALGVVTFVSIWLSYLFITSGNKIIFAIVSAIMILTFFGMECVKANEQSCVEEVQGTRYKSNL